jgi:nucleotide-binding universal stress UspA family protein
MPAQTPPSALPSSNLKSILVAVDDSDQSTWALEEAVTWARRTGATVHLLHVIDIAPVLTPEFAFDDSLRHPALIDAGKELLNKLSQKVPAALLGKKLLRDGSAEREIVDTAREQQSDLIVLGTHGRGLLGRFLLGSVAEAVVRHALCPVLTVSHPRSTQVPPTTSSAQLVGQT